MADGNLDLRLEASADVGAAAAGNRATLMQLYREIEAGNFAALAEVFAEDARFRQAPSLPYGMEVVGKEAVLAGLATTFAAWRHARVRVRELAAAGDVVMVYMQFDGEAAGGARYAGPAVEVFRFRDGKVIELWPLYWDTHAARDALAG